MISKFSVTCLTILTLSQPTLFAGSSDSGSVVGERIPDWVPSVRTGYLRQFESDIDGAGSFSVDRAALSLGISRVFDPERTVGLSLGYGYDSYNFDDLTTEPWSDIHTLRLGIPIRWKLSDDWRLFAVPTLRSTIENGASFSDGLTGGIIGGVSYTFGDRLSIGPGVGVLSQLEESTSVFPILLVKWKITDSLSFETGRGFGSSQGPGLNFVWQASENLKLTLGGRYEKLRFRLDDNGPVSDGIGEDKGVPVYLGVNYATSRFSELSVYAGAKFGGSITLENKSGDQISRDDYDTAFFAGIGWRLGF